MIPTSDEYELMAKHLMDNLDFEKLYEETNPISKHMFSKNTITESIKALISTYPDHFDESIKDRVESGTSVLNVRIGILNNYMYFLSKSNTFGWFLQEEKLFEFIEINKLQKFEFFIFDWREYIRNNKIKNICYTLKKTTK